jgi:hypothetical protein
LMRRATVRVKKGLANVMMEGLARLTEGSVMVTEGLASEAAPQK